MDVSTFQALLRNYLILIKDSDEFFEGILLYKSSNLDKCRHITDICTPILLTKTFVHKKFIINKTSSNKISLIFYRNNSRTYKYSFKEDMTHSYETADCSWSEWCSMIECCEKLSKVITLV